MDINDNIKWLESLKQQIGQSQHSDLWHFEQVIDETIDNLKPLSTPHGRLIDVATLKNKIESDYCNKCTDVKECGICVCQNCGIGTLFEDIDAISTIVEAGE